MNKILRIKPSLSIFWLNYVIKISLLAIIIGGAFFSQFSRILVEGSLATINGNSNIAFNPEENSPYSLSQDFLVGHNPPVTNVWTKKVTVTAYSSTPDQTDDTPFITASGKTVKDGIVASNFLAFGTRIRFPELYGDKIFIVEDRMHQRFSSDHVDIWMPTRELAQSFGVIETVMEILE